MVCKKCRREKDDVQLQTLGDCYRGAFCCDCANDYTGYILTTQEWRDQWRVAAVHARAIRIPLEGVITEALKATDVKELAKVRQVVLHRMFTITREWAESPKPKE